MLWTVGFRLTWNLSDCVTVKEIFCIFKGMGSNQVKQWLKTRRSRGDNLSSVDHILYKDYWFRNHLRIFQNLHKSGGFKKLSFLGLKV